MTARLLSVVATVALLGGCSAEQHAQREPTPAVPLTSQTLAALPQEGPSLGAATEPLALEAFTPLLALPELAQAAAALERDDALGAARAVQARMAESSPPPSLVPAWQLLLARLREQGGDLLGATASYELAGASRWPLSSYAWLGAGRLLIRAGRSEEALAALGRIPAEEPIFDEAQSLIAEAAALVGNRALAISAWRRLLEHESVTNWAVVSLSLAEALLDEARVPGKADSEETRAALEESLRLARRVSTRAPSDSDAVRRATDIERLALGALPPAERARLSVPTPAEQLTRVEQLVEARSYSDAEVNARTLLAALPTDERFASVGCEAAVLRGKALAGEREWGKAADYLDDVLRHCKEPDMRARALYLAGKYSDFDKRYAKAIGFYERLETEAPAHRLADDARLRAALSHMSLGAEARFTELLSRMPDDYPTGDMVLDGIFRLATRRIEKGDWSGAATILERGVALAGASDRARGHEFSARERYFLARAHYELGDKDRALGELEEIVRGFPLSYYMLQAYSRLASLDASRAAAVRAHALTDSAKDPFAFQRRPEFEEPGFIRALELLRQGEIEYAQREMAALGVDRAGAAPGILWGVALLYARAGAPRLSHAVARGLLTDWLERWPSGDWRKAWELAFPRPYHGIVQREAKKNGVPEYLVYAVMREESAFEPTAESPARAFGLMQLIEPTARAYAKGVGLPSDPASLKKPAINVALGCRVLADLTKRFEQNPLLAIPGYNAGPGRPRQWVRDRPGFDFDIWVELIPFYETRRYTKRVIASRAAYAFLYEKDDAATAPMRLPLHVSD